MKRVLAIILGGGKGSRLYPLTKMRAKPAVPLAGKYRLIDIPISNCINSGINKMYVLTQFNSASLNRRSHDLVVDTISGIIFFYFPHSVGMLRGGVTPFASL